LLLGRSAACDIPLDDRYVSRRHCRIALDDEFVCLEQMGNRNPTLVNGEATRAKVLTAGDHIALGDSLFLISGGPGLGLAVEQCQATEETYPGLSDGDPVYLDGDPKALWLRERPRTVHDLIRLYDTTRDLSEAVDRDDFMGRLEVRLKERFGPLELWVARARYGDGHGFTCTPGSTGGGTVPTDAISTALRGGQGLLVPSTHRDGARRIRKVTLAAPMPFGRVTSAALAIRMVPMPDASHTADLAFLVLLARSLAPLIHALDRAEQLRMENERLSAKAGESRGMVGESEGIIQVRKALEAAAHSSLNVLVTGETGTGKELAARYLHEKSARRNRPLVVVNCAAIPKDLFESELFGHTEGAFTGAQKTVQGLLSLADGGTLFLDEVGDLSPENQARILRVVEDGIYRPIGAREERQVHMRIVAATNKNLEEAIRGGAFREDLYHRLNGFEIHVPPLRERASDIPLIAEHFFRLAAGEARHPLRGFAPEAVESLMKHTWPGNVRELRNWIFRAVTRATGDTIGMEDLHGPLPKAAEVISGIEPVLSLAEVEKRHIETILNRCGGNVAEAAAVLGIGRSTLYRMLTEHRIVS
jgi:two-component system response regulator HydG